MDSYVHTAVLAVAWMIALLSLILWLERMVKIIMANYLIASILLWLGNFIDLVWVRLASVNAERRVDGLQKSFAAFLVAGKPTFLLTIYFVLLIFLVTKTHISIGNIKHEAVRRIVMMLFLPCTIISILLSVALAIYGNQIMNMSELEALATSIKHIPYAYDFVLLTPLRIILPAIVTVVIAMFVLRGDDGWKKEFVLELEDEKKEE